MKISTRFAQISFGLALLSCSFLLPDTAVAQTNQDLKVCRDIKADPAEIVRSCSVFLSTRRTVDGRSAPANALANVAALRGFAYARLGQYNRAIADYDYALSLGPNGNVHGLRASSHFAKRELKAALEDYDRAIQLTKGTTLAENYANRGVAYLSVGEDSLADSDFRNAIRLDPKKRQWIEDQKERIGPWIAYLKQIQEDGDYANWTRPPFDAAREIN